MGIKVCRAAPLGSSLCDSAEAFRPWSGAQFFLRDEPLCSAEPWERRVVTLRQQSATCSEELNLCGIESIICGDRSPKNEVWLYALGLISVLRLRKFFFGLTHCKPVMILQSKGVYPKIAPLIRTVIARLVIH